MKNSSEQRLVQEVWVVASNFSMSYGFGVSVPVRDLLSNRV